MSQQHIEDSLNRIRVYFEEATEVLDSLKVGDRIPGTKLAAEIAKKHDSNLASVYPVLKFLFEGYPGFKHTKGAKGGLEKLDPNAVQSSDQDNDPTV